MAEDVPVKNSSVAAHQEGIEISAESSSVQPAAPQKETIPSIARFIKYLSAYVNHSKSLDSCGSVGHQICTVMMLFCLVSELDVGVSSHVGV